MKYVKKYSSYFTEDGKYEIYRTIYSGERSWKLLELEKGDTAHNGRGRYFRTLADAKQWVELAQ